MEGKVLIELDDVRHSGVPIAIGMKVETKEGEETEFIISIPVNWINKNETC